MKKGVFFLLCVVSLLLGGVLFIPSSHSGVRAAAVISSVDEIIAIDQEIEELKLKKNFYQSKILRLEINADRWQFDSSTYQDARRAWKEIDDAKLRIEEIDRLIVALEQQKQTLLEEGISQ